MYRKHFLLRRGEVSQVGKRQAGPCTRTLRVLSHTLWCLGGSCVACARLSKTDALLRGPTLHSTGLRAPGTRDLRALPQGSLSCATKAGAACGQHVRCVPRAQSQSRIDFCNATAPRMLRLTHTDITTLGLNNADPLYQRLLCPRGPTYGVQFHCEQAGGVGRAAPRPGRTNHGPSYACKQSACRCVAFFFFKLSRNHRGGAGPCACQTVPSKTATISGEASDQGPSKTIPLDMVMRNPVRTDFPGALTKALQGPVTGQGKASARVMLHVLATSSVSRCHSGASSMVLQGPTY